jgi:hypothetical protein
MLGIVNAQINQTLRSLSRFRLPILGNLLVALPFLLLTAYIKLSTLLNGYSAGRTLRRDRGIELLVDLFSEPYTLPHEGLFTKVSEVFWCFPVALCFFSASLMTLRFSQSKLKQYLLACGLFCSLLLTDDLFRITLILHVNMAVPKAFMYALYGLCGGGIFVYFWRQIKRTPYGYLLLTALLMCISGLADFLPIEGTGTPIMLEDGTKLLGVLNLSIYFWQVCSRAITKSYPSVLGNSLP